MKRDLNTKWGSARINNQGYYQIKTRDKGFHGKKLHRLIFEEFYGEIPKGFHVHHKDGNKLNNCILNLQLLRKDDHNSHHKKNIVLSENHKSEISKSSSKTKNKTGFYRVQKHKKKECKQGFIYKYRYFDENHKRKSISSIDLDKLKQKVLDKGLEWIEY